MRELFRLRIAAKRQMTAPQRLMEALSLSEGDEIQLEVADGQIVAVHPCKAVRTALLSSDLLSEIRRQEHRLAQGKGLSVERALRGFEELEEPGEQSNPQVRVNRRNVAAGAETKPEATARMHRNASAKRKKMEFGTGITG